MKIIIEMETSSMLNYEFGSILDTRLEKIRETLKVKGAEYAVSSDRLHNFNRAAAMLNCTREQALVGMWTKHIISILDMVDQLDTVIPSEAIINEKIGDAINYLVLLEAALKETISIKGRIGEAISTTHFPIIDKTKLESKCSHCSGDGVFDTVDGGKHVCPYCNGKGIFCDKSLE